MNQKSKLFLTGLTLILGSLFIPKGINAATNCQTQYGGGTNCQVISQIIVEKDVFDPDNNKFVKNLGINDYKFAPGDEIRFQIKVKNSGDSDLTNVKVKDTLPEKLYFTNGPSSWNDKIMSFNIDSLKSGETKQFEVKARVVPDDQLPANSLICKDNLVQVTAGDQNDQDTARVCFERKVQGKKVLPVTGVNPFLTIFFILIAVVGLGFSVKYSFKRNSLKS